jgi:hypothetical protein
MDASSKSCDTSCGLPLSEADQAALRSATLHDLGAMPFRPGELISRSLWVIFIGAWGVWTHAVLPIDASLGMPSEESAVGLCDLAAELCTPPCCHDDEQAMVVLRRPGPTELSTADAYIFRLVRQALARREAMPCRCYVVGPDGVREVAGHEAPQ